MQAALHSCKAERCDASHCATRHRAECERELCNVPLLSTCHERASHSRTVASVEEVTRCTPPTSTLMVLSCATTTKPPKSNITLAASSAPPVWQQHHHQTMHTYAHTEQKAAVMRTKTARSVTHTCPNTSTLHTYTHIQTHNNTHIRVTHLAAVGSQTRVHPSAGAYVNNIHHAGIVP